MSLHPIKALDHVIEEYADYLRTEFRAKDPTLRAALDRELDSPGFLAQEPFYQAHRPFKGGKRWRDLLVEPQLARVMENRSKSERAYLHQSEAIEELLRPDARPVVVTTGTGSGKTEAFLLPVVENAWKDAATFTKPGLTAILVYPMNALANDQELRIREYLEEAGFAGAINVAKYDRGTSQAEREKLRKNPPHILLTNYMMLEYLLVRPADREAIFANHRCRFLVLDEVHTYRGILGSNIALLVRRLRVHLARARQDWRTDPPGGERAKRFPSLIPVGASATIKSMDEEGLSHERMVRLRDEAVQEFFGALAGVERSTIQVFGEELLDVAIPAEAVYPVTPGGKPEAFRDKAEVPWGIRCHNAWRKPKSGGRGPSLERILKHLLSRLGGNEPDADMMVQLIEFLMDGSFLVPVELSGARKRATLLQVNAEVVRLQVATEDERVRCNVCGKVMSGASAGMPCPKCRGKLVRWLDSEVFANRSVRRVQKEHTVPLIAGEHTAQITTAERAELEERFKAPASESKVNLLACSPTLEMGIDVGNLDAVVMRNIPPRPDNYAQRGGRAGRRSRVGLALGYARSTPHDQYFYDKPREMIAGEVPAPALSLGNRDVLVRHLFAIVFGAAEPGLAGRMVEYVTPAGEIIQETVDTLIEAVKGKYADALAVATEAWGDDILGRAGLDETQLKAMLEMLPERIQHVVDCTARQVQELRTPVVSFAEKLQRGFAAVRAGELINRLLGIQGDRYGVEGEADDRSAGYPLRRFAEFGILPGYEFPSQPAALRLLGDEHEEDPVTVTRRFGIGQFQPDANVYARAKRWKVIGLDMASPWNPRAEEPTWSYRVCETCDLRYDADEPKCPRCSTASPGQPLPSYEFAGFAAWRDESPILDEEDRYAVRNLVSTHPQWDGDVVGRWTVGEGWALRLSQGERVRWVNEGKPPTSSDLDQGALVLHPKARGYLLCPSCGRLLTAAEPDTTPTGGRRKPRVSGKQDEFGHAEACPRRGSAPKPLAISTGEGVEVLRLLVPVPAASQQDEWLSWGLSLGYALINGVQRHFMLGSSELDFELEGPWLAGEAVGRYKMLSLAFIDPSLGGSGYLVRIAGRFNRVANRTIEHLDHPDCTTACYRCLKSYQNQRHHEHLEWPQVIPALEALAESEPVGRPPKTGDIDDPRPWLEAYAAGVGSPLQLKFLRLFEKHGFHPQKQVPVSPSPSEPPISIADFAVRERRLAIYIDGAAFHVGQRLRRDRIIRDRLRKGDPPWQVEELRASDLGQGGVLVARLT